MAAGVTGRNVGHTHDSLTHRNTTVANPRESGLGGSFGKLPVWISQIPLFTVHSFHLQGVEQCSGGFPRSGFKTDENITSSRWRLESQQK